MWGLGVGVLAVIGWQGVMTLYSGYAFALRHAVAQPVTGLDLLVVALIFVAEAWFMLRLLPVRAKGRLRDWLRRPQAQA